MFRYIFRNMLDNFFLSIYESYKYKAVNIVSHCIIYLRGYTYLKFFFIGLNDVKTSQK